MKANPSIVSHKTGLNITECLDSVEFQNAGITNIIEIPHIMPAIIKSLVLLGFIRRIMKYADNDMISGTEKPSCHHPSINDRINNEIPVDT